MKEIEDQEWKEVILGRKTTKELPVVCVYLF